MNMLFSQELGYLIPFYTENPEELAEKQEG